MSAATARKDGPAEWGLYLFAIGMWSNRSLAIAGCVLMFAGLLRDWRGYRQGVDDGPLLRSLAAWGGAVLLSLGIALFVDADHGGKHLEAALRYLALGLFVPVGMILRGDSRRLLVVLALAVTGFISARIESPELSLLKTANWWELPDRIGLGLPPLALGALSAFLLMTLLIFLPRLMRLARGRLERALLVSIALLFGAALAQFLVVSLARSAWLAFATSALALFGVVLVQALRGRRNAWFSVAILVAVVLATLPSVDAINSRLDKERNQIEQLINGDFEDITAGHGAGHKHSIGSRFVMIGEAFEMWQQRPLFGHGPASPELSMRSNDDAFLRYYSDYHNAVLNILVGYGALGLVLFVVPVLILLRAFWRRTTGDAALTDVRVFVALSMWMLLLSAVLNYRLLNYDWRFWYWLVAGAAYGFGYCPRNSSAVVAETAT